MSSFSNNHRDSQSSPTPAAPAQKHEAPRAEPVRHAPTMPVGSSQYNTDGNGGQPRVQRERAVSSSRPLSMIETYHPSMMDVSQDTLPELQPIFTFLNSHANKLYQEGYFLKLDDQNTRMQSYCQRSVFLTRGRRKTKRRPDMDRMLCPACGDSIVTVGCCRARCSGSRWRSSP